MRICHLGLALLATACADGTQALGLSGPDGGSPTGNTEPFQSGSRLRAKVWDAGGGARMFWSWYDTALRVPCDFALGADGEFYCFPQGPEASSFIDANCTEPSLWVDSCPLTDRFVRVSSLSAAGCGYPEVTDPGRYVELYEVVGETSVETPYYGTPDTCRSGPQSSGRAYRLRPVPSASLVQGRLVLEPRGDGLAVWRVHAEDGAGQDLTIFDTARQDKCTPIFGLDQCLNTARVSEIYGLLDRQCITPLASLREPDQCPAVEVILERAAPNGPLCQSSGAQLRELGPAYRDVAYENASGQCSVRTGLQPPNLVQAGPVITQSRFPTVADRRVGVGPVQLQRWYSPQGDPLPAGSFFIRADSGAYCDIFRDADRTDLSYCVDPEEIGRGGLYYRDPSCQLAIGVQWLVETSDCRQRPLDLVAVPRNPHTTSGLCGGIGWELRVAGPAYLGPVYTLFDGRCELQQLWPGPFQGYVAYVHELGPRQDWSGQPVVRTVIE